ncbi:YDG domain-containing protein [Segetibacter aerophilus]|uniref:Secretion system C-terminal sorting domain-containing protein n=1 Tax=Segetibacter aerophilus TaxID=670293 RepID=A0A512BAJ4_9BACT|nr:YDG domain-containing protein [Segetibacter aerophilus]GEO08969.1 hypothetical protein SAE01_14650 [Segetibacter aerophilus]
MIIVDESDLSTQEGSLSGMFSVNMITGLDVGIQKVIAGTFANGNFDITYLSGTATIVAKEITITADPITKIYGEIDPPLTYKVTAGSVVGTDHISGELARVAGQNAGAYNIEKGTIALNSNYNLHYVPRTFTITPKSLSAGFTASNKVYDGNTAASIATRTLTGIVGTDDVSLGTSGTASFDTKNAGNGKTVSGIGFTLSGAQSGNYILQPATATALANITAKPITASFTANNKIYDGTVTATINTRALTGVISPDVVSAINGTENFDNKNVGIAKVVTGSGFVLAGNDAANYALASTPVTTKANISPAPLSITADLKYINQGGPLPVFTSMIVGLIGAEQITGINYSAASVNSAIAGVYPNMPSLLPAYPNYQITFNRGILYVNPAGNTAKKVITKLECIETVTQGTKTNYIAKFSYTNSNSTPFYIPFNNASGNNYFTAEGTFSGVAPNLINPGTNYFQIPFDGKKLSWSLRTDGSVHTTAIASAASATSYRCNAGPAMARQSIETAVEAIEPEIFKISLFPNPTHGQLVLQAPTGILLENDIVITDASGRIVSAKGIRKISGNNINLDVSFLKAGVYFLKLKTNEGFKTFRFVKL